MSDPIYRYRSHERAANLEQYDIVSTRNGGFIEVWEVVTLNADDEGDVRPLVLVTPRGDNHAKLVFEENERVEFLRPDEEPR